MYYFKAIGSILACVAIVKAQTAGFNPFITPKAGQKILAGQDFDILWEPSGVPVDATVSIKLLQGDTATTMQIGPNVASRISSKTGRFTWHVPSSIRDYKTYGFVMYLDGKEEVFQYSYPFDIECLDNNEDHPATPPVPKKTPGQIPDAKTIIPYNPDKHHDHDDHDDDKDDDNDEYDDNDKDDDDDHNDDDDDDHDDDRYHHAPGPTGVPHPYPKTDNGTYYHGVPKPSGAYPPAAKPSSQAPPAKPKPEYTSGAKMIAINSFALLGGIAISFAF